MKANFIPHKSLLSPEMDFFIFLLEQYAAHKHTTGDKVFEAWSNRNLVQWIYDNSWGYHTDALENAFRDIDSMMATGKPAW